MPVPLEIRKDQRSWLRSKGTTTCWPSVVKTSTWESSEATSRALYSSQTSQPVRQCVPRDPE